MNLFEFHRRCLQNMTTGDIVKYINQLCPKKKETLDEIKEQNISCDDSVLIEQCLKELKRRSINPWTDL